MTDHLNPALTETARPYSTGLAGLDSGRIKRCSICDIRFKRTPNAPIPDELCERCHTALQTVRGSDQGDAQPNAPQHSPAHSAAWFLEQGLGHMRDRAATYDKPEGERSMAATVRAFNAITGDGVLDTAERGWMLMVLLKLTRSQQGRVKADNYEDAAAYAGLMGEAAMTERQHQEASA